MKHLFFCAAFIAATIASHTATAQDRSQEEHLEFSLGFTDALRGNNNTQFDVAYKSEAVFQNTWDNLLPFKMYTRPMAGGYITTDDAHYIFGGAAIDVPLSKRVNLAMHAVVGHYSSGDIDLGGPLSFREGIGLEYLYNSGARVGFSFDHNSNAFLYDINPGTETLRATYSHPINFIK